MNDLQLLMDTMDRLNVYYSTEVDSEGRTLLTLEEDPAGNSSKLRYRGYQGFAYTFVFDDGKLIAAGGYE